MTEPDRKIHAPSEPETWVDLHGDALFRFAMTRIRNPDLAEEMVQETFLAAFRSKDRFAGRASERTWLTQILRNKIVDHYRRRKKEITVTDLGSTDDTGEELFNELGRWNQGPSEWNPDPSALLQREEFIVVLESCLGDLPERQAEAFSLRVLDEIPSKDACNLLNVTATNLGVLLHRARMRLRRCLELKWFEREDEKS